MTLSFIIVRQGEYSIIINYEVSRASLELGSIEEALTDYLHSNTLSHHDPVS